MKYKLTLLKDLPEHKAGTVVLNITQEELDGTRDYKYRCYSKQYNYSDVYDLRNNAEWVKVDVDNRCDCLTKPNIDIEHRVLGYGRIITTRLSFENSEISSYYESTVDCGTLKCLPINYCPLCGRKL